MKRPAAVLLLLALAACSSGARPPAAADSRKIQIFYNNDNNAYLETCGCRVSPIGGLDRRWNAFQAYPASGRVFVDAGNLLFKSPQAAEFLSPQWFEQAIGVIDAYNLLDATAVAVGENEFALGVAKFQELAARAHFPFLSANLYWRRSGALFTRDRIVVERFGKKIGIFGLFGTGFQLPGELEARDPLGAAKLAVSQLRAEGADMIVALSHQGYDADIALARALPGIDLVVGAHSQSLLQQPDQEGPTLIVQLSNQGQMLGMVEYEAASLPHVRTNFVVAELDNNFNENSRGLANPMKSLVAATNLRVREANRSEEKKIWADSSKVSPVGFETFLSCRDCHAKQAEFHEGKAHSAAFLTLMAKHKEADLDCVKCHSVGLGQAGGFSSLADAFRTSSGANVPLEKIHKAFGAPLDAGVSYRADLSRARADAGRWIAALKKSSVKKAFMGVQCESCHGVNPGHPFGGGHWARVAAGTCLQCHTKEQAPAWHSSEAVQKAAFESMKCPR